MRTIFQYGYGPLLWFGGNGLALWLIGSQGHSALSLLPLGLAAILLSFLAKARLPFHTDWNRDHHDRGSDRWHALINEALNSAGIVLLPLLAGALTLWLVWPTHWPLWTQWLLALVVADAGITLMQWLSHRRPFLWRLHAVHHSAPRLYGFNGLMKHPLHQGVEALGGLLPLLLLGLPAQVGALLAFSIALQLLLQHSNVDMKMGPLRHLFAWAPVHRLHHLRYGRAGDVNFALFFPLWDRLLGTAMWLPNYRLRADDVGIGAQPDYPRDYRAQLSAPWRTLPEQPGLAQPSVELATSLQRHHPQLRQRQVGADAQ